jgi:HTH-type transcriptional regulator, repressor for puuD
MCTIATRMTPAGSRIFRSSEIARVDRGGGVYSLPMVSGDIGAHNLMTGMTVFPPGGGIALHTHNTEESVVILEGNAVCEIDGTLHPVETFDAVYIPAGIPHRFSNGGDGVLRILWIYGSIDMVRTYVDPSAEQRLSHLA